MEDSSIPYLVLKRNIASLEGYYYFKHKSTYLNSYVNGHLTK